MTATQDAPAPVAEIGRDRRRKEDQRLITGRTRWTDNLSLPGMLHLAMVRSPFAHAKITSIDTTAANADDQRGRRAHRRGLRRGARRVHQRLADHPGPGDPHPLADAGRPGRVRRRDRRRRGRAHGRRGPRRRRAGRRGVRGAARRTRPQGVRGRHGARAPRPRHQQVGPVGLRLRGGRHRRRRRGGDRQGAHRRRRHRARVPPAAADPVVHGAPFGRRRPDRRAVHDVVGHADPAHPAVRAGGDDRRTRVEDPRDRARRGRRLRRQAPGHPGGVDRLGGRAADSASR